MTSNVAKVGGAASPAADFDVNVTVPSTETRRANPDTADEDHEVGGLSAGGYSPLVVITGGSKGIGKACVESFARRGARVLFTYCSDATAARCVESAFVPIGQVQCRQLDQGDFESVRAFASEVDRWRGDRGLDVVVNNAALGSATVSNYPGIDSECAAGVDSARKRAEEDIALMRVNALGPMWLTEALLPMMRRRAGKGADGREGRFKLQGDGGGCIGGTTAAATGSRAQGASEQDGVSLTPGKKTVLFIGSVGGGSQSVFPGFRAADAMSKAALAYACKHFAARSRDDPCFNPRTEAAAERKDQSPDLDALEGANNTGGTTDSKRRAAAGGSQQGIGETDLGGPGDVEDAARRGEQIDFVCLCPGATLTDMFRASTLDAMSGPAERSRFMRALPQGRMIEPREISETVYWLCTCPAASIFHGAVIDGSGGLAVRPGALTEYRF